MGVMNLAEIMDMSIEIIRKHIKTILLFTLLFGVILIGVIFVSIIGISIISIIVGSILSMVTVKAYLAPLVFGIVFSFYALLLFSFSLASNIGMIKISSQEFLEERIYVDNALKATFKNTPKVLGIVVTLIILFIPIIAIFAVIAYFLYTGFEGSMISIGIYGVKEIMLIILLIITILAAILVTLGFITLFLFSLQAIAIENKGVVKSLKRSYQLVKNNYLKTFGCMILFSITVYAIRASLESFIALASSIVYLFAKFLNIEQDYNTYILKVFTDFQWPLTLLSLLIITPIATSMITLLYFNQRFKKEGYDIVLKLKKIQKNEERKQLSEFV